MTTNRRFWFRPQWVIALVALVIALLIPLYLQSHSPYWLHVLIVAYFYAILASSWSLLAGYAGQFSFGHMAFMAIGAYTTGVLGRFLNLPPLPGMILGTLAAGLAGWAIGALCLRFKASYLALFTIAFSEILRTLIRGEPQITRGDHGLRVAPLFGETISKLPHYYTMLAVLVACMVFMYWLANSRVGLFLPCRVTVVEHAGKVQVMSINPKTLSHLFNNEELDRICGRMEKLYQDILEEATL